MLIKFRNKSRNIEYNIQINYFLAIIQDHYYSNFSMKKKLFKKTFHSLTIKLLGFLTVVFSGATLSHYLDTPRKTISILIQLYTIVNPNPDGLFRGCSRMGRVTLQKSLSHISYKNETWHSYTLPK